MQLSNLLLQLEKHNITFLANDPGDDNPSWFNCQFSGKYYVLIKGMTEENKDYAIVSFSLTKTGHYSNIFSFLLADADSNTVDELINAMNNPTYYSRLFTHCVDEPAPSIEIVAARIYE